MRMAVFFVALVLLASPGTAQQSAQSAIDQEHTQWIASVIESAHTIQPGMTRRDLLHVFKEEGGISSRAHRTYVYKLCPYIKVDVDFKPVGQPDRTGEGLEDEIVKISQPYLDYGIMD
jgi:hypothetical protein